MSLPHPEVETFLARIPGGDAGIRATLAVMGEIVREYKKEIDLIQFARNVIAPVPPKHYAAEATALYEFVRDTIRYTQDVDGVEVVQTPENTIMLGHGDCDDMSVLLATLLAAVGKRTRFVAAGFDGGPIEHVWVEVLIGDRWFAMDPTEIDWEFGDRPPGITSQMVWHN